jgi:hypothetical protein
MDLGFEVHPKRAEGSIGWEMLARRKEHAWERKGLVEESSIGVRGWHKCSGHLAGKIEVL